MSGASRLLSQQSLFSITSVIYEFITLIVHQTALLAAAKTASGVSAQDLVRHAPHNQPHRPFSRLSTAKSYIDISLFWSLQKMNGPSQRQHHTNPSFSAFLVLFSSHGRIYWVWTFSADVSHRLLPNAFHLDRNAYSRSTQESNNS